MLSKMAKVKNDGYDLYDKEKYIGTVYNEDDVLEWLLA